MLNYSDDVAVPKPQKNEVLINVTAAGVNNTDINTRIEYLSYVERFSNLLCLRMLISIKQANRINISGESNEHCQLYPNETWH